MTSDLISEAVDGDKVSDIRDMDPDLKVPVLQLPDAEGVVHVLAADGVDAHDEDVPEVAPPRHLCGVWPPAGAGGQRRQLIEDALK